MLLKQLNFTNWLQNLLFEIVESIRINFFPLGHVLDHIIHRTVLIGYF